MSRKIFVSYNFNDRHIAHGVGAFFQGEGGPCQGKPEFVPKVDPPTDAAIDNAIRTTLKGCVAALFVIGDDNHNSPWINREAELVRSGNVPFAVVRILKSTGGPPNVFNRKGIEILPWDGEKLAKVLNRLGVESST